VSVLTRELEHNVQCSAYHACTMFGHWGLADQHANIHSDMNVLGLSIYRLRTLGLSALRLFYSSYMTLNAVGIYQ